MMPIACCISRCSSPDAQPPPPCTASGFSPACSLCVGSISSGTSRRRLSPGAGCPQGGGCPQEAAGLAGSPVPAQAGQGAPGDSQLCPTKAVTIGEAGLGPSKARTCAGATARLVL